MAVPSIKLPTTPKAKELDWYGLRRIGYDEFMRPSLTGDWLSDQLSIEFWCFRIAMRRSEGGLGKFGHFKRIVDLLWNNPKLGGSKRFIWNAWAERMLRKACECDELGVAGPTSAGKCCSPEQLILMFDGSAKRAGDIVVGDVLMGDDSTPRAVQEVHRGRGEMFKVTPSRGAPWYCTGNHTLVLKRTFASPKGWRRVGEIVEIEAEEFMRSSLQFRRSHKQFCVGVNFPAKDVWLDPRMLGLWLGDGHKHYSRISIPDGEPEVLEYVRAWCEREGFVLSKPNSGNQTCPSYQIFEKERAYTNPFFRFVREECIIEWEKRIPRNYLINSVDVRTELLAGLMDSDGHASGAGFEICTQYAGLKDDIVFLARSLGFRVSAKLRMAKCGDKTFPSWRIYLAGDTHLLPTLRKHCRPKTLRLNSDCVGITVTPAGVGDWIGFSVDGNRRHLLGDFTVTHNSDPFALWVAVNYLADPTHTKCFIMSTSLDGAKLRVWKTFREYMAALPDYPGKPLWSTNRINGPDYTGVSVSESSGVMLLAGEKSKEKDALEKLLGIKAPRTGDADESLPALKRRPEFAHLVEALPEEELADLLPRLVNLSEERTGQIILVIDEATGVSDAIRMAVNSNMKPGNKGHFQVIMLGNPNLHWDTFGMFCQPKAGWQNVSLADEEWETESGGTCIRFNGEKNPRITEKNEQLSWMLTEEACEGIAHDHGGKRSLGYFRFVLGFWCPQGADLGVYAQSDFEQSGAMGKAVWGLVKPTKHSSLDPAFTVGGDKPSCTFFDYGLDPNGIQVVERTETIAIPIDAADKKTGVSYQVVRNWRRECEKRGVLPENACFDSSGAPSFADIVRKEWSPGVQAINTQGKASTRPVGHERSSDGKKVKGSERFFNRVTEVWFGAHPFFRCGQIRGIDPALAKQICSRKIDTKNQGGRSQKIESKRAFKDREGHSPDDADSFFTGIEHLRTKGFRPADKVAVPTGTQGSRKTPWEAFRARAMRISFKRNLKH